MAVGFAAYDLVASAYPDMKRTVMKFGDSRYAECNLYAFLSARGRSAAAFWRQVEATPQETHQTYLGTRMDTCFAVSTRTVHPS